MHRDLPARVRRYGFEVLNVPVDDRPRISGQSKYTNLRRALVGIVDLLGVYSLLRRTSVGSLPIMRAGGPRWAPPPGWPRPVRPGCRHGPGVLVYTGSRAAGGRVGHPPPPPP